MESPHEEAEGGPPAVELRAVTKRFGAVTAVDALSLRIPARTTYGFIGPNGAGKTTAIRMIMDIIAPDEGEVLFFGAPRTRAQLGRIGYLPEERGLYQKMKLRAVLSYFGRLKGLRGGRALDAAIDRWLDRMSLLDRAEDRVEALSKGNQQKLQFVSTVLHDPDLVILDEPFSGLDPVNMQLLADVITEMRAEGKTVIFSSHVMEQAERLCEHVFMIARGRKVLDGPMTEIKERYRGHSFTVEPEGDGGSEPVALYLEGFRGLVRLVERRTSEGRTLLDVHLQEGAIPSALLAALAEGPPIRRVERHELRLHDIFVQLADAPADGEGEA